MALSACVDTSLKLKERCKLAFVNGLKLTATYIHLRIALVFLQLS